MGKSSRGALRTSQKVKWTDFRGRGDATIIHKREQSEQDFLISLFCRRSVRGSLSLLADTLALLQVKEVEHQNGSHMARCRA